MGSATVVDQLIVKLGLDPRDFEKGQKRAAAELVKTQQVVKKQTGLMNVEFVSLAKRISLVAVAIATVKKGVDVFGDLATDIRQLGIDSKAFNISASMLRNWQNVAEMMGGKAEDVTKTVGGLTKAVYDLAYNGQVSDSIVMLGRLGVRFQNATGEARDFTEVVADTEAKLQQLQASGTSSENALQMAMQAGFDPGLARAIVEGRAMSELARQEQRRQVTGDDVSDADALRRSVTSREQATEAAKLAGLDRAARMGIAANEAAEATADIVAGTESMGGAMNRVREAVPLYDAAIRKSADVMEWAAKLIDGAGDVVKRPLGMRNNNPGNLMRPGTGLPQSFATIEDGVRAASAQLDRYASRGIDTIEEIVGAWAPAGKDNPHNENYMQHLEATVGVNRKTKLTEADRALMLSGMFEFEQGRDAGTPDSGAVDEILRGRSDHLYDGVRPDPTPYVQGGRAESASGSSTNSVDINKIEIHTQARDADGIARNIVGATTRKFNAAQADTGMN